MPDTNQTFFKVYDYSEERLKSILSEYSKCANVDSRPHFKYFTDKYFKKLGVKTLLVEVDYIDRDYLDDYSSYYVKCFHKYERKCTRLHLFRTPFSEDDFKVYLEGGSSKVTDDLLQEKDVYLGFVIIRPLPQCIIGRSCVSFYRDDPNRFFPVAYPCSINLFGLDLKVESIDFQEQDQVTAACATSALWSAFHVTSRLFQHRLPSPVEITREATTRLPMRYRAFPNVEGLSYDQMAQAIRSVGLEPLCFTPENSFLLKSAIFSYLMGGIPLVMTFSLCEVKKNKLNEIGIHAVTVTGFYKSLLTAQSDIYPNELQLESNRIDKLYVHDDQVGPFARMKFIKLSRGFFRLNKYYKLNNQYYDYCLDTSWGEGFGYQGVFALPGALLIPIYHKIRIRYDLIYDYIITFDKGLYSIHKLIPAIQSKRPVWDIKLSHINKFKTQFAKKIGLPGKQRYEILTKKLPRFLWWASASVGDSCLIDILFDATDIASGPLVRAVLLYDYDLFIILSEIKENPIFKNKDYGQWLNLVLSCTQDIINLAYP